jgi:hypothetical protein
MQGHCTIRRLLASALLLLGSANSSLLAQEASQPSDPASTPQSQADAVRIRQSTLFEGALLDSHNGQDFVESSGWRKLFESVSKTTDAAMQFHPARLLSYEDAMRDPELFRGEWVSVRGVLNHIWAEKLDPPIGKHPYYFRGILNQTDGSDGVMFDVLLEEAPHEIESRRDLVEIEGVFYRTVRYETRQGVWLEAPYVIVRRFGPLVPEDLESAGMSLSSMLWVALGIAATIASAFYIASAHQRERRRLAQDARRSSDFRYLFQKRAEEERALSHAKKSDPG